MELALYCPVCGFYEKESDSPGRHGDFYTSVSVGSLFGELLAFQFSEWLTKAEAANQSPRHRPWQLVEAGAHDGRLARDILKWLQRVQPDLATRIEYWIIEPSARRQTWQREWLRDFAPQIRWAARPAEIDAKSSAKVHGVIFSNELLDAMPVHRVGWDAGRREWFEWGVALGAQGFSWTRLPAVTALSHASMRIAPELLEVLPDGFTTEVCPAAEAWWREAASVLQWGKLLTIDYGLTAQDLFTPARKEGTLRAYHRHRLSADLLSNPGEQDLTAHVNFTAIQSVGEAAGLKTELFQNQAGFLTPIAERAWQPDSRFGSWSTKHTRQFQTLTHPEHLGRAFHVLVQTREDGRASTGS